MKVKQTPISQAVFIALLGATGAAMAQQAQQPNQQLDTVTVTGIRASQEKSLSVKRNADTHIDVISAEDIGKMPDKNVADSLARIPGVTILNSPSGGSGGFDERDRVGLRGTNPSLTQTLLDATRSPTATGSCWTRRVPASAARSASRCCRPNWSAAWKCTRTRRPPTSRAARPAR